MEIKDIIAKDNSEIIETQRKKDLQDISKDEGFLSASKEVNARDVANTLRAKSNDIQNEELNRELEEYILKKKKEKLDLEAKLGKDLMKQEVKADINEKKRLIAEKRYGYLYTEVNGKYKDFTQSKSINRFKEINNWYKGLSDNLQKAISTTVKFMFKAGITVGAVYVAYKLLQIATSSGLIL